MTVRRAWSRSRRKDRWSGPTWGEGGLVQPTHRKYGWSGPTWEGGGGWSNRPIDVCGEDHPTYKGWSPSLESGNDHEGDAEEVDGDDDDADQEQPSEQQQIDRDKEDGTP